ncbi:AIPR family protein [Sphingorhabdus arenilitoris]|uniref:AIPR family protein n=1 Tax=Sphingorhabdus arenilitoris TaxID=1490041 RepID=A0ABV8RDF0_9SPHN
MSFDRVLKNNNALVEEIGEGNAYLILALALLFEEANPTELASAGLTDGGDDKKIDFIYHDVDARRLIFAQGYFTEKKVDSAPANKASDLNTACAWLVEGKLEIVPEKLRATIASFRQAIDDGEIDAIDVLYVHNLPESINVSRELQTTEGMLRKLVANDNIVIKGYELGKPRVEHLYSARDSHIAIADSIYFPYEPELTEAGNKWKASIATVSGDWISDLFVKYGDDLYSANYRGFLGADRRKKVNSGIRDTAENAPNDFWVFNNGITVLTNGISKKGSRLSLNGISVINGAQTTGSIGSVDRAKSDLGKVRLICRIVECQDQETVEQIVKFNNTQNVITTWDQFSNDQDQKRIADEFNEIGFSYNRKRGFVGDGDQIGIEQVLQPLLAYHGRSTDAVRGKNQLFLVKQLYRNAFEAKKARHILFVHTLSRAIDNLRLDLKKKSTEEELINIENAQLALLKNLNFKPFLINVVANSLETIVGQRCDSLTTGFKPDAAKGRSLVDLTARWIPVVETFLPLLTPHVEPETFFRLHSNDDQFIVQVKKTMDAMLVATNAKDKLSEFAKMVAAT